MACVSVVSQTAIKQYYHVKIIYCHIYFSLIENRETDVPIRIPTPIEPEPQQEDEEIEPPEEVPSAWAEPRAPVSLITLCLIL